MSVLVAWPQDRLKWVGHSQAPVSLGAAPRVERASSPGLEAPSWNSPLAARRRAPGKDGKVSAEQSGQNHHAGCAVLSSFWEQPRKVSAKRGHEEADQGEWEGPETIQPPHLQHGEAIIRHTRRTHDMFMMFKEWCIYRLACVCFCPALSVLYVAAIEKYANTFISKYLRITWIQY